MKKDKERYTFNNYIEDIEFYKRTSPFESSYQRVIENVLKDVLVDTGIELIVSDKFRRCNTKKHCVTQYKDEKTASPDLMLAKNFSYYNKKKQDKKVKFYAYVEIKIPGNIKINDKSELVYNQHDKKQLQRYLLHDSGHKIIFTDGYSWIFYHNDLQTNEKFLLYKNKLWDSNEWDKLQKKLQLFIFDNEYK